MKTINEKLINQIIKNKTLLIIGLDTIKNKIPKTNKYIDILSYNKEIIKNTYNLVIGYKINTSFYEYLGVNSYKIIKETINFGKKLDKNLIFFADAKIAEIGEGVNNLIKKYYDLLGFDYLMMVPWFGYDSFEEVLKDKNKGVSVYIRDSNPSSKEIQDLKLENKQFLFEYLAYLVKNKWDYNNNLIYEAAATYPEKLKIVRKVLGEEKIILTSGIGTQGGKVEDLKGLFGKDKKRLIVSISRSICFPQEIYEEKNKNKIFEIIQKKATEYKNKINQITYE